MKNETVKTGVRIGATIGGLVFALFGMPGFYFGSFGTLILLQKLMGTDVLRAGRGRLRGYGRGSPVRQR